MLQATHLFLRYFSLIFFFGIILISCSNETDDDDVIPPQERNFEVRVPRNFLNGIGSQLKLSAFINNEDVSDTIEWSTNNQNLATIDQTGQVLAIGNGTFRAEVVSFEELVALPGLMGDARKTGQLRLEGKGYRIEDGEIVHFRFNV